MVTWERPRGVAGGGRRYRYCGLGGHNKCDPR